MVGLHPTLITAALLLGAGCNGNPLENTGNQPIAAPHEDRIVRFAIAGQALLKVDPRSVDSDAFQSVRPLLRAADVAFTNFEMAVNPEGNGCNVPPNFVVVTGEPPIARENRPGNTNRPHSVSGTVMEYLADLNFRVMSLANNHSWDLGRCGIKATIQAAQSYGIKHAGTGTSTAAATEPVYFKVNGVRFALIAANTSDDEERHIVSDELNGIWTGVQDDWDRNIDATKEAASKSDVVVFYHHYQVADKDFVGIKEGQATSYGHYKVDPDVWQTDFSRAVIEAGASIYIGHGHRGFDGIEIYQNRPIIRQLGNFAYHGRLPQIGAYHEERAWWGLLATATIRDSRVRSFRFHPLNIDEGEAYVNHMSTAEYQARRGVPQLAQGELARKILTRFQRLSAGYGASVVIEGDTATLEIASQ